jgi:hypothetical protein
MSRALACCLLLLGLLLSAPGRGEESARLGLYMDIARDLNRADARAVLELWAEELTRKFQVPSRVSFYGDMTTLRADFDAGRINMVIADAMSFVRHFKREELAEGFTTKLQQDASLLLLARDGSAALAGKRVALIEHDDISAAYMEVLCLRQSGQACLDLPVSLVPVSNNHQATARLLFGQADLALVNRHGYLLATELNPQLGRVGRVVNELSFDTQYFGFFSARVEPAFRTHALRSIPNTHKEVRGRQLLDVFRVDRLALADAGVLQPFYALERELRERQARVPRRETRK